MECFSCILIISKMHFFQIQEQRQYNYECIRIDQFRSKMPRIMARPSKKPYQKYRNMKQAIELIEEEQRKKKELQKRINNGQFIPQLREEVENLRKVQSSCNFRQTHHKFIGDSNISISYQEIECNFFEAQINQIQKFLAEVQNYRNIGENKLICVFIIMKQLSPGQSKILSSQTKFLGKWLGISSIDYSIGEKVVKGYQAAFRPKRRENQGELDGVEVVPIIKKKNQVSQLVFIANFRPSVGAFCVQFPAGLMESQDIQENAFRELQEETGLKASKLLKLPALPIYCDPWKSNENGMFYIALIDGDSPDFQMHQQLDNSENIRVFTLPLDQNLCTNLKAYTDQKGYLIHTKIWTFCCGFNFGNFLNL